MNDNITLWEEKNSTEPKKNSENKNESETNGITKNTETELKKNVWTIIGGKKIWPRKCNHCGNIVYHTNDSTFYSSKKYNKKCEKCRQNGKENSFYGKRHTSKTRELYSQQRVGKNNSMYGKFGKDHPKFGISKGGVIHHSTDSKLKMSLTKKKSGKFVGDKNAAKRPDVRQKIRESILKKIKLLGYCGYNPKACEFIDKLNEEKGWNLQHALNGGEIDFIGYRLDGYDKKRNIVFEYDEPKHYKITGELKDKDVRRMTEIKNYLHCKFLRYNERLNEIKEL